MRSRHPPLPLTVFFKTNTLTLQSRIPQWVRDRASKPSKPSSTPWLRPTCRRASGPPGALSLVGSSSRPASVWRTRRSRMRSSTSNSTSRWPPWTPAASSLKPTKSGPRRSGAMGDVSAPSSRPLAPSRISSRRRGSTAFAPRSRRADPAAPSERSNPSAGPSRVRAPGSPGFGPSSPLSAPPHDSPKPTPTMD